MKVKIKQMISILLTITMLFSVTPEMVLAQEFADPKAMEQETVLAETGVTVTTQAQFIQALEQKQSPITVSGIITMGKEEDVSKNRLKPVMIPAGTTIQGTTGSSISFRSPVQLGGDNVTFKNIELNFISTDALSAVPHREIYLAGYSLTMDNVKTYTAGADGTLGGFGSSETELLPIVYAGSYPSEEYSVGQNAKLNVTGSSEKTMFKAMYMGYTADDVEKEGISTEYTGQVAISLDAKALVREGIYTDKNTSAIIDINGENGITAMKATKFVGNANTKLTVTKNPMYGASINGVGTVELKEGAYLESISNQLETVIVGTGSYLDLTPAVNVSIGTFIGTKSTDTVSGSALILDREGCLEIRDSVSGTTYVQTGVRGFPEELNAGQVYIKRKSYETDELGQEFILLEHPKYDGIYELEYAMEQGVWIVNRALTETQEKPIAGKFDLISIPQAIDIDKVTPINGELSKEYPSKFIWYDEVENKFSNTWAENYLSDSIIIMKTEYWKDKGTETINKRTDWSNPVYFDASNELDTYYLRGQGIVQGGDYTFIFLKQYIENYNLADVTVEKAKEYINSQGVIAEIPITFYKSTLELGKINIADASKYPIKVAEQVYTGEALMPEVLVEDTDTGITLQQGVDYIVNYSNNIKAGEGTVTVIGIGSYTGTREVKFNILRNDAEFNLSVDLASKQYKYGDMIRFTFQANPKVMTKASKVRSTAENTVDFYCGEELLGTAAVDSKGQAVLNYQTTDRKIPVGEATILAYFGGTYSLRPSEQAAEITITLEKKQMEVVSMTLKDFVYNGSVNTAIQFVKLKEYVIENTNPDNGTTEGGEGTPEEGIPEEGTPEEKPKEEKITEIAVDGEAILNSAKAGSYSEGKVVFWLLGEEENWYELIYDKTTSIPVEPAVEIAKAAAPAPVTETVVVAPNSPEQTIPIAEKIPKELTDGNPHYFIEENTYENISELTINEIDGMLKFTAKETNTALTDTISILVKSDNYEDTRIQIRVIVSEKTFVPLDLIAYDKTYDGNPYTTYVVQGAITGTDTISYYDTIQQIALQEAPTEAGSYAMTVRRENSTQIGEETTNFKIVPKEIRIKPVDKAIIIGGDIPKLDTPTFGVDYVYELGYAPIPEKDLGATVLMNYSEEPDTTKEGEYPIIIGFLGQSNENYDIKQQTGTLRVQKNYVPVTSVLLNETNCEIDVGNTITFVATVMPENATNKELIWSSNNTNVILTENPDGTVTATGVRMGTARVTVTATDTGLTASCDITVKKGDDTIPVTALKLDQTRLNVKNTGFVYLTANITPLNATNQRLIWSSDNANVSIGTPEVGTGSQKVKVTAKAAGRSVITVKTPDEKYSASCTITIEKYPIYVEGIKLDRTSLSMKVGDKTKLIELIEPQNATTKTVTWKSSDSAVATVDTKGNIIAKAAGRTEITVTTKDGNFTATCNITVQSDLPQIPGGVGGFPGGGGGGGGAAGGSSNVTIIPTPNPEFGGAITGITGQHEANYKGEVILSEALIQEAINETRKEAEKNGTLDKGIAISAPVQSIPGQEHFKVTVSGQIIDRLLKNDVRYFEITSKYVICASFDLKLLKQMDSRIANGDLILRAERQTELFNGTSTLVRYRPVYDITLAYTLGTMEMPITKLYDNQMITIKLPYMPMPKENIKNLHALYIDKFGNKEWVKNSYYEEKSNAVVFKTNHFSIYAVAFKNPSRPKTIKTSSYNYNQVKVSWSKVDGAIAYQLYRATSSKGTYKKIKTTKSTSFIDSKLITGKTYYYKVRAYTHNGEKIIYTAFTANKTGKPVVKTPTLKTKKSKGKLILAWNKISGASGYEVYRSTKSKSGYKKLKTLKNSVVSYRPSTTKKTYYYKVRAYRVVSGKKVYGSFSKVVKIK